MWVSQVGQDVRSDLTVILQHTTLRLCILPDQKNGGGGHWCYQLLQVTKPKLLAVLTWLLSQQLETPLRQILLLEPKKFT